MTWRAAIPITVLLALSVATGCGDDGGAAADTSTSSVTKAELIRKADAICTRSETEFQSQLQGYRARLKAQPPTKSQERQIVADYQLPSLQDQVDGIAKLGAPDGEDDQVEAILDGMRAVLAEGREDPGAMLGSSSEPWAILGSSSEPLATAADLARKYGFKVCFGRY